MMDFLFEISAEGHGVGDVAELDAMRLLEAFEENYPEAGAAVGADLRAGILEATFSARGKSLHEASESARQMFLKVAGASGLSSVKLIGFTGRIEPTEQALAS